MPSGESVRPTSTEVPRVLQAGLKSHRAVGKVYVRGIAREQHATIAVPLCLTTRVSCPSHPPRLAHRELGADMTVGELVGARPKSSVRAIDLRVDPIRPPLHE